MAQLSDIIARVPVSGSIPYEEFKTAVTQDGNLGLLQSGFNTLRKSHLLFTFEELPDGSQQLIVQRRATSEGAVS